MRLIDADALKSKVQAQEWKRDPAVMLALDWIYMLINEQPTIDAVPVVRCEECKHGRYDDESEMYECGYVGLALYNEPNHYCSYGAKMEGERRTRNER